MKRVLLFSSPRSGSTLLANIIHSHPAVEFYNEIFTRAPYLLPNFERAFHRNDPELRLAFEKDFVRLSKYKLQWKENFIHRHKTIKFTTFLFIKVAASIVSRLSRANSQWNFLHKSYHINSLHEPPFKPFWLTQFIKVCRPDVLFIKDVRMRKAFYAFREMYPDAYFIYLIRNPYFVIASTLRQRQINDVSATLIDEGYLRTAFRRPELVDEFFGKTTEQNFALQWVLENEMIADDLLNCPPQRVKQIRFEDMVADLKGTAREIFAFIGCEYSPQTERYLEAIRSYSGSQKHNRSTFVSNSERQGALKPMLNEDQLLNVSAVVRHSHLPAIWGDTVGLLTE